MSKSEILVFISLQKKAFMKCDFTDEPVMFSDSLKMVGFPLPSLPFALSLSVAGEKYESKNGNDKGMWLSSKILQNHHCEPV